MGWYESEPSGAKSEHAGVKINREVPKSELAGMLRCWMGLKIERAGAKIEQTGALSMQAVLKKEGVGTLR